MAIPRARIREDASEEATVSALAQNYLITIFLLKEDTGSVTISRLADQLARSPVTEHLGSSLPSVAGMVRRMKRDGLLDIKPNKEIVFTDRGRRHAEAVMRRHMLAEVLLVNILGLELHEVHAEAHRLEHAISPKVEERMATWLGNPLTCPFGHPIPGSGYRVPKTLVPLEKIRPGVWAIVERIPEDDSRLVKYLVDSGIVRGNRLKIIDIAPYKGTITLEVLGKEVVVGLQVAPRILVKPD